MQILSAELCTNDIGSTSRFFSGVLGLPINSVDQSCAEIGIGRSRLLFRKTLTVKPVYHLAFSIPFVLIDKAVEHLSGRAELCPSEGRPVVDFPAWNARSVYFLDNNGNILEFIGRKDHAETSPAEFSATCISSMSEVGIVTDDPEKLCDNITATTGVRQYKKQPMQKNFAAMGDDNGLLIVSSVNRHWFPTEIPAMKFPLKIIISNAAALHTLQFHC